MPEYHIRIQDIQPKDMPRERLLKQGPASLSDSELLAVILRSGTKGGHRPIDHMRPPHAIDGVRVHMR